MKPGDTYEHSKTKHRYEIIEIKGDAVKLKSLNTGTEVWTAFERFETYFKKIN